MKAVLHFVPASQADTRAVWSYRLRFAAVTAYSIYVSPRNFRQVLTDQILTVIVSIIPIGLTIRCRGHRSIAYLMEAEGWLLSWTGTYAICRPNVHSNAIDEAGCLRLPVGHRGAA
jgi:hypothetical protein